MISIGFCKKPHGVGGELKVRIEAEYLEDFLQAEVIFLDINSKQVPYFIEKIRPGNELLVKLEDVDSREAAAALNGKEMFLREEDIHTGEEEEDDEDLAYEDLVGYEIIETDLGSIGKIEDVLDYPQQMMALLTYQEREILIPLNEYLIQDIDVENQKIIMELPEGLLEL